MNINISFIRFVLALSLLGWGQFVFSQDYYWSFNGQQYSSASAACSAWEAVTVANSSYKPVVVVTRSVNVTGSSVLCQWLGHPTYNVNFEVGASATLSRIGTGCPANTIYNAQIGECESPPEPCPEQGQSLTAAVNCSLSGGNYVHTDQICVSGCLYTSAPNGFFKPYPNYDDPAKTFCMASFASSGQVCSEGSPAENIPPEQTATPPSPDNPDAPPSCLQIDGHEFCPDPDHPNCGSRDGNPYCYGESDTCGQLNGQHVCLPNGSRKCTYVDGSYECVNESTGEKISSDSADHPLNGGNADGNDRNDAQKPGEVVVNVSGGGAAQGSDKGATNKAISDLQEALEGHLEGISDALTEETESTGNAPESPTETGDLGLDEWDEKIEEAKLELSTVTNQFGALFQGITSVNLSGSGGQLYCETFTVMNKTYELCLSQYADQLEGIGLVILFLAALLAVYIIFIR